MWDWHDGDSPLGRLYFKGLGGRVDSISLKPAPGFKPSPQPPAYLLAVEAYMQAYFQGQRDLPQLALNRDLGTPFQRQVWQLLTEIPYGQTRSYKDLALALGDSNKVRAIGQAVGKNPWLIVLPCHRVIGSGGALVGFAYGTDIKKKLLAFEQGQGTLLEGD